MKPKEFKIGDFVRVKNGAFISTYCMTVNAIETDIATCCWYNPTKKGLKLEMIEVPVKDLVHEKHSEKSRDVNSFIFCLN